MPNYAVHIYTQVRVKVKNVVAESPEKAATKAEAVVDFHSLLDQDRPKMRLYEDMAVEAVEYAESVPESYLVDPLLADGEVDYESTQWLDGRTLEVLTDCRTAIERKAKQQEAAALFMQELLASYETLGGIAVEHGAGVVVNLLYLQNAILTDGGVDVQAEDRALLDVVGKLPSAEKWRAFTKELVD